jgi:hypothetical protein
MAGAGSATSPATTASASGATRPSKRKKVS